MTITELKELAKETGFEFCVDVNMGALEFREEVREMCAADKCHAYNHNWACPPACGTLDEMREKVQSFSQGILIQTMAELEDDFDFETMAEAGKTHRQRFMELADKIRAEFGTKEIYIDSLDLVIGAHSGPGTLALFFVGDHR